MTNEVKVLNDDALREIEARRAAVKSKWTAAQTPNDGRWAILGPRFESPFMTGVPVTTKEVAEFISKAPEDIDSLCATVRALRVENKKLKDRLAEQRTQNRHLWEANKEIVSTNTALREQLAQLSEVRDQLRDKAGGLQSQLAQVTQERDEQVHQAELAQERLQTAVQLALQGLHERCCEVAALQWFQHEYTHAVIKVRDADEATVFALRKGLPTLTGKQLP